MEKGWTSAFDAVSFGDRFFLFCFLGLVFFSSVSPRLFLKQKYFTSRHCTSLQTTIYDFSMIPMVTICDEACGRAGCICLVYYNDDFLQVVGQRGSMK